MSDSKWQMKFGALLIWIRILHKIIIIRHDLGDPKRFTLKRFEGQQGRSGTEELRVNDELLPTVSIFKWVID
jgi:hypothetical protein